ncbi:MAG: hypothetical protein OEZ25_07940 [Candidatus Bathyarchaeota archaeon]|nr:hypothetical protein [Candidatus Bathyarchaeota archaeon]
MSNERKKMLLVGDNPFHGISHLSQERARVRGDAMTHAEYAANLVMTSLENGANGFMFSVSEMTLSILRTIREMGGGKRLRLYAIVPYVFEYVRLATQIGMPGLTKKFAKQIVVSGNVRAIATGLKGVIRTDPSTLMKTYLIYEISRIKSSAGKQANLDGVLLHEIITDMAVALDLDWLFKSYVDFMLKRGIKPGFNTRNFTYLVNKFREWSIDLREIIIATPFNKVGFQMNPSRTECEKALANIPEPNIIAISILAAGYLKPPEAIDYIATLPNIKGVAVGVSKEHHARETFKLLRDRLREF